METQSYLPETSERVAESTDEEINLRIQEEINSRVWALAQAGPDAVNQRLEELDYEWDIERCLEANAAAVGFMGTFLGATVDRRYYLLPALVGGFLFQHALQGWCPPVPVFRRFGVRTMKEVNEERFALKVLRGDFDDITKESSNQTARSALEAVRK